MSVESPEKLFKIALGFWNSQVLMSAVAMGLFKDLSANGMSLYELCEYYSCDRQVGRDFFDTLVSLELLVREGGCYTNSELSESFLVPGKKGYIGGWVSLAEKRLVKSWAGLSQTIEDGRSQNESRYVGNYYDHVAKNNEWLECFVEGMDGLSRPVVETITNLVSWKNCNKFVDIGGGRGTLALSLVQTHSHLIGIVLEKEEFRKPFLENINQDLLENNLSFLSGDFFFDPFPSADAFIFGFILHNWPVTEKKFLLSKAHDSLRDDGILVIYESVIDNERSSKTLALQMSLNMALVTNNGVGLTMEELAVLLSDTGFAVEASYNVSSLHKVIIARKI